VRVNNHNNFSGSRGILGSSGNLRDQQHAPFAMKAIPASHATSLPNGSAFSITSKMASAAIQKRVITPPTKSNSVKAQHQPIQDTLIQPQPISASEYSKPLGMSLRTR